MSYLYETETVWSMPWFGGRLYLSRLFFEDKPAQLRLHFVPKRSKKKIILNGREM